MSVLPGLRAFASRLRALFARRRDDAELSEEIQAHLDLLAEEYLRRGLPADAARSAARREFGAVEPVKEEYRDQRRLPLVETVAQDIRYAIRTFRRSPGFVVAVVLSLSLGIGANSAIFSVLNALMLRSLPVHNPEELFAASPQLPPGVTAGPAGNRAQVSYPVFEHLRRSTPDGGTLAATSRIARMYRVVDGERELQTTAVQLVSGEFFPLLGVPAARGRLLTPDDNRSLGGHPLAVISHAFWLRAFGGSIDIVGRGLTVNGTHFTIVGVSQSGFSGVWLESPVDVWIPLMMQADVRYAQNYSNDDNDPQKPWVPQDGIRWLDVFGRRTNPESGAVAAALETAYQQTVAREAERIGDADRRRRFLQQRLVLEPFGPGFSNLRSRFAPPLFAVFGMAALILLIACANSANLLLARAAARQREIAIRLSIGASRGRVIRQLLTESVLLAAAASAVGSLFAGWAGDLLVRQALGATVAAPFSVDVNGVVVAFTIAASAVTVLLFGFAPAFRTTNLQLATALKVSAARGSGAQRKLQGLLVGSQVALSLVLLVGAGLLARTLLNYGRVDVGFSGEHVLSVWINPLAGGYSRPRLPQLSRSLVARVEAIPGVATASVATCGLATGCQVISNGVSIEGYQPGAGEEIQVQENYISPNYFATTDMRLAEGRHLDDRDGENAPKVAIINRAMGQRFFSDRSPVGRRFGYGTPDTEIVGVVEDARVNGVRQSPTPMVFYPMAQGGDPRSLDVRAVGDPRSIAAAVRAAVHEVEPGLPIDRVTILSEQVASGLNQERLIAILTSIFGGLALGLACFGLFGVMAYAVSGRMTEFGIRMALGAAPGSVKRMVVTDALRLVALGLALGVPLSIAVALSMRTLLFGVEPQDLVTLIGACLVLIAAGMFAAYVPARRAAHVDPMVALRCE